MKNFILSVFSFAAFTTIASAQVTYHANIGAQSSNFRGNGMSILDKLTEISSDYLKQGSYTSFYAGASANIPIAEHFSIEPGLQYSKVGATLTGNLAFKLLSVLGVNASAKAISQRLEMPVLLKAEVAKGLSLMVGPQLNYAFSNKLQIKAGALGFNVINKKFDINSFYEPLSAAALGGLEYQFPGGMRMQAMYEYGISKIVNNGNMDIHQNSIKVGLGIPLNFGHKDRDRDY
jgi:hypothetical protein